MQNDYVLKDTPQCIDGASKVLDLSTQEVHKKWNRNGLRNWSELYPLLCIFFSETMENIQDS